jgi:hypothetical protein
MRAKLKMIKEEMWRRMHQPIPTQGKWLWCVVNGYFNYHAVPTNAHALHVFRHHVTDLWRRTLRGRRGYMKTRTHFPYTVERLDKAGEIVYFEAGVLSEQRW